MTRSTVIALLLTLGSVFACGTGSAPDEPRGSTQAHLESDDDDAVGGDDDDSADSASSDDRASPSGLFSNWCRADVDFDDRTGNPTCVINVWCGGWSTKSVVVSGPDGDPPCECECQ